jgi:hypothetical protein
MTVFVLSREVEKKKKRKEKSERSYKECAWHHFIYLDILK